MKTRKFFTNSIVLLVMLILQPVQLFAKDNNEDLKKKCQQQEMLLKIKDNEIAELRKKVESLQLQIEESSTMHEDEETLENEIKKLREEKDKLKEKVKELESNKKSYNEKDFARLENENKSLRDQIANLKQFEAAYVEQLASSVDDKWLNKLYKDIDTTLLNQDLKQLSQYIKDPTYGSKIREKYKKMEVLSKEVNDYNDAENVVNNRFNQKNITESKKKISSLIKNHNDDHNKKNGLNRLLSQLNNFEKYNSIFCDIIQEINEKILDLKKSAAYSPKIFFPWLQKNLDEDLKELRKIPYIDTRWRAYEKALKDNFNNAPSITKKLLEEFGVKE